MLALPSFFRRPRRFLTLSKELGIAVRKEVDDGSRVGLAAANVLLAGLSGDERPELLDVDCGRPLVVAEEMEVCAALASQFLLLLGCRATYASCRPFRSNRDGLFPLLVHIIARSKSGSSVIVRGGGPAALKQTTTASQIVAYTCPSSSGGGAFRSVSDVFH